MAVPHVNSRIIDLKTYEYTEHESSDYNIPEFTARPKYQHPGKFYYGLRVVTGNQADADPEAFNVTLSLTGDKGTTGDMSANVRHGFFWSQHRFRQSTYDDIIVESDGDLGDILIAGAGVRPVSILGINITAPPDWYIDYFTVANYQINKIKDFPCYHWLDGTEVKDITVSSGTATLKNVSNNSILVEHREKQLQHRQNLYKWQVFTDNGVPSGIDESFITLPRDEQFERAKQVNFLGNVFKGGVASTTAEFRNFVSNILEDILKLGATDNVSAKNISDFEFIAQTIQIENLKSADPPQELPSDPNIPCYEGYRWVSDVEFGRQILNGVDPVVIRKCTEIPDNFAVTGDMVNPLLSNGNTLDDEMKNGRVYICDLSQLLHEIPTRAGYYCAAPLCLLYVNASNQLVPIAIQLKRDPGPKNPVFLPTDSWFEWLLAKIYYRAADAQWHQISSHYISCHASMEAYGVATMRNLPDAHPLYKLIQPHCRYTMSINSAARATLINPGGIIAKNFAVGDDGLVELFKRAASAHRVHWTNIKRNIKERGVDNPKELPGYYFRDDGVRIWDAIEEYVQEIVDLHYKSDDDVKNDTEVNEWAQEIHTTAFPGFNEAPQGHGFPRNMNTKAELVEYCTLIIFTGSAQHAAVNFGQFDIYGYTPNAPIGMRKPAPEDKNVLYYRLLDYLPDISTAAQASSITFSLAQFSPDEVFLGEYPEQWYSEDESRLAVKKFKTKLEAIESQIISRNKALDVEYFYLCPSHVPNSITI